MNMLSDPFDEIKIAKLVLKALGESSSNTSKLEMLLQRVKNSVSKKKFLIVLDNVWTEDRRKLEPLKNSLKGVPKSRILATRSDWVVRVIGTDTRQPLGQLSDEDCRSLLSRIAFVGRNKECEKLEDINKKIELNCNGLPLATKTIGSMLCLKDTVGEWLNALESPLWQVEEETILIVSDCGLQELPQEIGKFIYLRCLDLSFNPIRELLETLCDLFECETNSSRTGEINRSLDFEQFHSRKKIK
ncbi:putative disease resistance protein RGA3 [Olea europaea var. sylvestris]|uniref:putative disease resistance protein RGA3 n=1 Tax=Olea europaea var. sylvestris TaxID=158386 RepID=UPI000C1D3587|nr:putative disease resistance protein RGA3 [Olea europaea var. sylvestris]